MFREEIRSKFIYFHRSNKQKLPTAADEEDKAELRSKKLKTGLTSFGDFSAW